MADGAGARWQERAVNSSVESARQRALSQSLRFVEAGLELLAEPDRTDLTVTEVVERAGVSLRTFYQRFGGKDEFMLAVVEEFQRRGREKRSAEARAIEDPEERLRTAITGIFRPVSPGGQRLWAAIAREYVRLAQLYPAEIQQLTEPTIQLFEREVERGIERGVFRRGDPAQLALMIYHLVAAHSTGALLGTISPERAESGADALWSFVQHALRP